MLLRAAESIPSYLQKTFLDLGPGRIQKALEARQGCRFIEELLLDTILLEREAMRILHPPDQALASNKSAILKAFRAFAL